MNKEQAKDQLIEILENQVVDLTMMSKIELGDDVIAEIKRLKAIIDDKGLVGRQFILDSGSLPVLVIVKDVTEEEVTVEYLYSTPGRIEKFSIADFEHLAMIKILNMIELEGYE
jgi:hypothetical protein